MTQASKLDFAVETITPAIAKEWLGLNQHNRNPSRSQVARYARDMKTGKWGLTAEAIRFNCNGALIDGQHRLLACVLSDTKFETLVVRGLPVEIQEKLDQGKMRSAYDHLHLRGVAHASGCAAAVRQLIAIRGQAGGTRPTNAEVLEVFERHPNIATSIELTGHPLIGLHPSIVAAIHYVGAFLLHDREIADSFVRVLETGEPSYDGDAAHVWRERLISQEIKTSPFRRKPMREGTIHAWNLFRRREPLKIFRLPETAAIEGLDLSLI